MYSHHQFVEAVIVEFPELANEIPLDEDLPHLQMGMFAQLTNRAIRDGDKSILQRAFALARRFFHDADAGLKNEFYVSYLEALELEGAAGARAREIMPPLLVKGRNEITAYLAEVRNSVKPPSRLRRK